MSQYTTPQQVQTVVSALGNLGGGVKSVEILPFLGPYQVPVEAGTGAQWNTLTFNNGATGFNVGLILQLMQSFPTTWPAMLALEINQQVPLAEPSKPGDAAPPTPPAPKPPTIPPPSYSGFPPMQPGQVMTLFGPVTPVKF